MWREAGTFVGYVQLDAPVRAGTGDMNRTAAVAQSVVDHVCERLFEAETVPGKARIGFGVIDERPLRCLGPSAGSGSTLGNQRSRN